MKFTNGDIVLVGAGGHARVVADAIRAGASFRLAGYVSDLDRDQGRVIEGVPVLGDIASLADLKTDGLRHVHVAIGQNEARGAIAERVLESGLTLALVLHPSSIQADNALVEDGVFLGPGAIVNAGAKVRQGAIVNTGSIVEHDCEIGRFAHLAPGACLTGHCELGDRVLFGAKAVAVPRSVVEADAMVGAGAVVVGRVGRGKTVRGNPAR